jgi:hypothetical protein
MSREIQIQTGLKGRQLGLRRSAARHLAALACPCARVNMFVAGVRGRSQITESKDWLRLDLEYIDRGNIWLDTKILLRALPVVFFGWGAKQVCVSWISSEPRQIWDCKMESSQH